MECEGFLSPCVALWRRQLDVQVCCSEEKDGQGREGVEPLHVDSTEALGTDELTQRGEERQKRKDGPEPGFKEPQIFVAGQPKLSRPRRERISSQRGG